MGWGRQRVSVRAPTLGETVDYVLSGVVNRAVFENPTVGGIAGVLLGLVDDNR